MALLPPLNPPLTHWHGQHVWIIGASSGIGRALASQLHAAGAKVCVSARSADALNAFVADHPGAMACVLDVTDASAWARAWQALDAWLDGAPLAYCSYCAGHYRALPVSAYDRLEMERHLAVNYQGALHLLEGWLPRARAQAAAQRGGHLSLVSSVAGLRGLPLSLAYGPTKAALTHLAEILYLELKPLGLGVSVIHPGFVETPLTAQNTFAMPALMTPDAAATRIVQGHARGQFQIQFPRRFTAVLQCLRRLPDRLAFAVIRRFTLS